MVQCFENESQATAWARQWLENHADKDEARNFAITLLIREGYGVQRPCEKEEWLSLKQLCAAYAPHLSPTALANRLHRSRPPFFLAKRGPSGRILAIQPNPLLIDFISQPVQPGRRHDLEAQR